MKTVSIGLLGAVINNDNMGCVALTYSLINMLEKIANELDLKFEYYVFEGEADIEKIKQMCGKLLINENKIHSIRVTSLHRFLSMVHHPFLTGNALKNMHKCALFVDLTSGDSFSDIYGQRRFDGATHIKEIVCRLKKPLILGPQTYGPFKMAKNQRRAKKVIEKSYCVLARDQMSADYVACFSKKEVYATTDLAFGLPFEINDQVKSEKIKIGINISSLLVKRKEESTEINFSLKTDYDMYVQRILDYLTRNEKYDVYVIPHVGRDAGEQFRNIFPTANYLSAFSNPMDAKNYIAKMDVFIGARMHATIAAFSSGVATIPTAYSPKFNSLYENLDYPYVVDLSSLCTEEAVEQTIDYLKEYEKLKSKALFGQAIAQKDLNHAQYIFSECVKSIINEISERNKNV